MGGRLGSSKPSDVSDAPVLQIVGGHGDGCIVTFDGAHRGAAGGALLGTVGGAIGGNVGKGAVTQLRADANAYF